MRRPVAPISPRSSGEMQAAGVTSLNGLAKGLTERGIPAARGGSTWSASQVSRLLSVNA